MNALIRLVQRLLVLIQHVLPQHLLSGFIYRIARIRWRWFKNVYIHVFIAVAGVDMSEAASQRVTDYPDFATFFTRELRDGARPLPAESGAIVSPVDGTVSQIGRLEDRRLLQAKGMHYSAEALLGAEHRAAAFRDGGFATIYLAPHQYHRVHMPVDGVLTETVHVPGRLFSVAEYTVELVPDLFARNERLISIFQTPAGPLALVMVGAMLVSSIETVWAGELKAPRGVTAETYPPETVTLRCGQEMGRFNMGSTVILLFGAGRANWDSRLQAGSGVLQGQKLGEFSG